MCIPLKSHDLVVWSPEADANTWADRGSHIALYTLYWCSSNVRIDLSCKGAQSLIVLSQDDVIKVSLLYDN